MERKGLFLSFVKLIRNCRKKAITLASTKRERKGTFFRGRFRMRCLSKWENSSATEGISKGGREKSSILRRQIWAERVERGKRGEREGRKLSGREDDIHGRNCWIFRCLPPSSSPHLSQSRIQTKYSSMEVYIFYLYTIYYNNYLQCN